VTVLDEECEDGGGRGYKEEDGAAESSEGEGDDGELSGFAIRRPPRALVRFMSPLMMKEIREAMQGTISTQGQQSHEAPEDRQIRSRKRRVCREFR
jgi:hypothetical protein